MFGTWNVKTLQNKEEEIVDEIRKYNLSILGLSVIKKKGSGEKQLKENHKLLFSGVKEGRKKKGVGFVITEEIDK